MSSEIKLIKSTFTHEKRTKQALLKFLSTAKVLSFGEQCQQFEKAFAHKQGRKKAVFVNSGSSANLAIIQSLLNLGRLQKGDKVAFSSLTWSTNVMPLIQLGLIPVPVDVEVETLNVSSQKLLAVLEKEKGKIKAFFITNLLGFCDDLEKIAKICQRENILLIEDNCESLGSVYKNRKLGNFGLASTCSFYVGHHLSTIEGGMICTDDPELTKMLQLVRAHGWDRNLGFEEQDKIRQQFKVNSTFYSRYTFYDLGYNLRPTEIAGFLGNYQMQFLPEIVEKREKNFLALAPILYAQTEKYYPIKYQHMDVLSSFAMPIVCKTVALRDELVKKCAGRVEIRPIVGGDITQQPFFLKHVKGRAGSRGQGGGRNLAAKPTNSNLVHQQGIYFGNNPELTKQDLKVFLEIFGS